jgi:hypothetical protein
METRQGHFVGSVEHSKGKVGESVVAIPRLLCDSPCLCQLRTEGWVPVSKYGMYWSHTGFYRTSKPSSLPLTEGGFITTVSMAALGEKLGTDSRIGQPVCCGLCREPIFSRAVTLSIAVDDFTKGCRVRWLPTGSVRGAYVDWHGKRTYRIDLVFPCRVYIDSKHRDSWIWVTACSLLPSSSNLLD